MTTNIKQVKHTIWPAENVDQLRELRAMVGTLVGDLTMHEREMARALDDTRSCLEDVDRGWGAANVAQHAARLGREEAAVEAAYTGLKAALQFAIALYGRETAWTVLVEVGGGQVEHKFVKTWLENLKAEL